MILRKDFLRLVLRLAVVSVYAPLVSYEQILQHDTQLTRTVQDAERLLDKRLVIRDVIYGILD
jgi:hypothetical protein